MIKEYYYVYVIRSLVNKKLYVGFTADIENRINKHNDGKVRSTKAYKPYKLVYKEQFNNKREARKRELYLKSGEGREYIKLKLNSTNDVVMDRCPSGLRR